MGKRVRNYNCRRHRLVRLALVIPLSRKATIQIDSSILFELEYTHVVSSTFKDRFMALIAPPKKDTFVVCKFKISETLKKEVMDYCAWAGIDSDHFFAESAAFVFSRDNEWKAHKQTLLSAKQTPPNNANHAQKASSTKAVVHDNQPA